MYPWEIIWRDLKRLFRRRQSSFQINEQTIYTLQILSERRQRSPDEVLGRLLSSAMRREDETEQVLMWWDTLSPREQQVTALICKKMTNKEIALHMGISANTVKTYVERIMAKFQIHDREELRNLFNGYDLSKFE